MAKLNPTQQSIVNAFEQLTQGTRAVLVAYIFMLEQYWTTDRRNPDNLAFFLTVASKRNPRIAQAARKLLPLYAPVTVKGSKEQGFKCENIPETSKKKMVELKSNLAKFKTASHSMKSLLDHEGIKVVVEFDWTKASKSFQGQITKLHDEGVSKEELLAIINKVYAA